MRLNISAAIFSNPDNHLPLLGILARAVNAQFFVTVSDPSSPDYIRWLNRLDPAHGEAWSRMLDWAVAESATRRIAVIEVVPVQASRWHALELTLADAIRVVDCKFHVLLENGRADRAFFLSMAPPDIRRYFLWLETRDLLEFVGHGGISELRMEVEQRISRRSDASLLYFAMFDSDSPRPGVIDQGALLAIEACATSGIEYLCLSRRAIENYLPLGAVSDFVETSPAGLKRSRRRIFQEFSRLTADQRHHFRMKTGLPATMNPDEQQLFGGLSPSAQVTLSHGFSSRIAEMYDPLDEDRLWAQIHKDAGYTELEPMYEYLQTKVGVPYNA